MSILNWIRRGKINNSLDLPDPSREGNPVVARQVPTANESVQSMHETSSKQARPSRGPYNMFKAEDKARVGRFAAENGNTKAAKRFSTEFKFNISESTVRNFKRAYLAELNKNHSPDDINRLSHKHQGRPVLLGETFDQDVQSYVRKLRLPGGIVNMLVIKKKFNL